MSITYGRTPRGFTTCQVGGLKVQESSAINGNLEPSGCLRDSDGSAEPGSSYLWFGDIGTEHSSQLDREQVAGLVAVLARWLAAAQLAPEERPS